MAIEIVDFPINSMVIFQFAMFNYQRVTGKSKTIDSPINIPRVTRQMFLISTIPIGTFFLLFRSIPKGVFFQQRWFRFTPWSMDISTTNHGNIWKSSIIIRYYDKKFANYGAPPFTQFPWCVSFSDHSRLRWDDLRCPCAHPSAAPRRLWPHLSLEPGSTIPTQTGRAATTTGILCHIGLGAFRVAQLRGFSSFLWGNHWGIVSRNWGDVSIIKMITWLVL